jgi:RNA-splicing ligase RtcB
MPIRDKEEVRLKASERNINSRTTATRDLQDDYKELKNKVFNNVQETMTELGPYAVHSVIRDIRKKVKQDMMKQANVYYDLNVRMEMYRTALTYTKRIRDVVDRLFRECPGGQLEKMRALTSKKFQKLLDIFVEDKIVRDKYVNGEDATGQEMRNITFVMRQFLAQTLCRMLREVSGLGKAEACTVEY